MTLSPEERQAIAALEEQFAPADDASSRMARRVVDATSEVVMFLHDEAVEPKFHQRWHKMRPTFTTGTGRRLATGSELSPSGPLAGAVVGSSWTVRRSPRDRTSGPGSPIVVMHLARAFEAGRFHESQTEERAFVDDILESVVESDERERVKMDLEYLLARLSRIYAPKQARTWLRSYNVNLHARPLDVLLVRGLAEVISALEVEEQNAF